MNNLYRLSSHCAHVSTMISRHVISLSNSSYLPISSRSSSLLSSCNLRTLCTSKSNKTPKNIEEIKDVNNSTDPDIIAAEEELISNEDDNELEGRETRGNLYDGLQRRSVDAIRYEYYATRADVEAETDAAMLFRSLAETSKQQAMGFIELMEDYGEIECNSTMDNLDLAADAERDIAQNKFKTAADVAAHEGLEQAEEWFDDLGDASLRAASRLDAVHAMLEDELVEGENNMGEEKSEEGVGDVDEKRRH